MYDQVTLKLNVDPLILSALREDITSEDVSTCSVMRTAQVGEVELICKENGITYSLAGGSLLGAIRHKGYIPWDDDVDIIMPRKDYENFLQLAQEQFEFPFFVQYYKTENYYPRGHAQIRNSNTTAIIQGDEYNNFNKGIFKISTISTVIIIKIYINKENKYEI